MSSETKTINDLIKELIEIRDQYGNLFVKTQTQVGTLIDFKSRVEIFFNESKTFKLPILIIEGYRSESQ